MYSHCADGGWILGHLIDGTQAEFVRIPHADNSLYPIQAGVDDEEPLEVLRGFTARRIDAAFQMQRLTREILDDDGDDLELLARWLAYPDMFPGGRGRGFVEEIHELYSDIFADMAAGKNANTLPDWAIVLEIVPPFRLELVREAYRARSLVVHPDVGGSNAEFVKLRSAYETAVAYCKSRGR